MNKLYVLTQTYPSETKRYQMAFIHPRVKSYIKEGFDVKVISFKTQKSYIYDGVQVLDKKTAERELLHEKDIVMMSHSPNLRSHIPFIKKWDSHIKRLFLFFHGHESLYLSKYYPKPFKFTRKERRNYLLHKLYDPIKLRILGRFIKKRLSKGNTELIYVSNWFCKEAAKCISVDLSDNTHIHIINNGLNEFIREGSYKPTDIYADVITIRPIDLPKYGIDLIVKFANEHPELNFHVYGKGDYFLYNDRPKNLKHIDKFFLPNEIPELINHYKYAIFPTYQDTQGVMMCEMATQGIPTLVSDIAVCHEMLDEYPNVIFISNENFNCKISEIPDSLDHPINRFSYENTIGKEVKLLKKCFDLSD